jgi:hypothetical protein
MVQKELFLKLKLTLSIKTTSNPNASERGWSGSSDIDPATPFVSQTS